VRRKKQLAQRKELLDKVERAREEGKAPRSKQWWEKEMQAAWEDDDDAEYYRQEVRGGIWGAEVEVQGKRCCWRGCMLG
jgi:hypothetical protein